MVGDDQEAYTEETKIVQATKATLQDVCDDAWVGNYMNSSESF